MTETSHTRSRRAALGGLIVQVVATGVTLALSFVLLSPATSALAWYLLGGVPIWFVALLVFRQRELADLEAMDLEELRRERKASGGGEAIFDSEGGAGLAFRIAQARLEQMQKWVVPGLSLLTALYLAAMGLFLWRRMLVYPTSFGGPEGPGWDMIPIALVVLAIIMLGTFLLARYTSGMSRNREWQLLRGCGSYMLGNAIMIMFLMVCLGVAEYTRVVSWERTLAYIIPIVMVVLAAEMVINFVLDSYRPRAPGIEARAAFDSRLLGLIAEPGGIASSIADALNYQFGFQVSQTWFYQLLERTFVPMLATGALALWLMTCVVIVQPYEHVIVERFGRQLNPGGPAEDGGPPPAAPLGPGIHFKLPYPIDIAQVYNTGQLHQLSIGWQEFSAVPRYDEHQTEVLLWTDPKHLGLEHFDFLMNPVSLDADDRVGPAGVDREEGEAVAVHMLRMEVAVQYRIREDMLHRYSQRLISPHRTVRDVSWEEVVEFNAGSTVEYLLGEQLNQIGHILRQRISERLVDYGIEVVYVGVTNVHPEMTVSQAYREVIQAEQEKLASIREARVTEQQRLSAVAGDAELARSLAMAVRRQLDADRAANGALRGLRERGVAAEDAMARLFELRELFQARIAAAAALADARERQRLAEEDYRLGLGETARSVRRVQQMAANAQAAYERAEAALAEALEPIRTELQAEHDAAVVDLLVEGAEAQLAARHWNDELNEGFTQTRLGGEAAAQLAQASAERWDIEMDQAAKLVRTQNEQEAFRAAPDVYKTRRLVDVLVNGLKNSRKFFLAFDPGDRVVRVRFVAEDEYQPGIDDALLPNTERE